ncbi:Mannan endo-1,4-beta-mannosidase F [Mycena indigotica]|uniref:mannan endo-1,4-beta-mannosidase n=1 Tax=Mycena indigotica TaxID=2126181 RepID=A0A8H6S2W9_9AGAR|nr:Mannan endo-1,4-beta-mannosidase F [Mycena indigotica]KAF7291904.1 Mannan endo-1,4-beta-mannosidase F [Mycena indigotica]
MNNSGGRSCLRHNDSYNATRISPRNIFSVGSEPSLGAMWRAKLDWCYQCVVHWLRQEFLSVLSPACVAGSACVYQNPYYSQCLPSDQVTTTVISSTTVPPSSSRSTSTTTSRTSSASAPAQTGFVKTSGTRFTLNGSKFTVVGSNAYWPGLLGYSTADINKAFTDIANSGATTVRTWGFNEATSPNGVYFHLWNGATATVNTGANGLQVLDTVIASAKAHGIRLIIALTNNWSDFGGMDTYTAQILGSGQPHDAFYTNSAVIVRILVTLLALPELPQSSFKTYVQAIVSRYVNEPTIMAWELANEPRCGGSNTQASSSCTPTTITTWASNISAYIKSIDSNHLVALGDEGFFNQPNNSDWNYRGTMGVDFAANMKISTLDFGTFHLYPIPWGESNYGPWGQQWIIDHATVMNSTNKPVIIEEFGVTSSSTRNATYASWYSTILSSGLTGDLLWQAGSQLTNSASPDDGYAIYPTDPVYALLQQHAAQLKARA